MDMSSGLNDSQDWQWQNIGSWQPGPMSSCHIVIMASSGTMPHISMSPDWTLQLATNIHSALLGLLLVEST